MLQKKYIILFVLSLILAVLILMVSLAGLNGSLYGRETPEWRLQCVGQDLVDLLVVLPALLAASLLLLMNPVAGRLIWPGIIFYLAYTFAIYCFDVRFNTFFIEYCAILALSVYGLAYFLYSHRNSLKAETFKRHAFTTTLAIYFLTIGLLFYFNWLVDIAGAIHSGALPARLGQMQLPTNPVHVLDLSVLLPMFIITAVLLLRKKPVAIYMAAYLLVFSVLMNITILMLGMPEGNDAAVRILFSVLAAISGLLLLFLLRFYKKSNTNSATSCESSGS